MTPDLDYAVITPAHNEEDHLPRLASALAEQTMQPHAWVIVENNSTDRTLPVAEELARTRPWIKVLKVTSSAAPERGAPIVRALHAGFADDDTRTDVVVNVDADVWMEPDYFERVLREFAADPRLGIASGSAWELQQDGEWAQRFVTGGTVWGAVRAYRRACLDDVLPLEERHGWDGLDQLKARAKGWRTQTFLDLGFRHHRREGEREDSAFAHWRVCGETAHYMGYRPWYLVARALFRARHDLSALGMLRGFFGSALRRSPQWEDREGRERLRRDQSVSNLLKRRREALGLADPLGE